MNLRISKSELRLRLTRVEAEQLLEKGELIQHTMLPYGEKWTYGAILHGSGGVKFRKGDATAALEIDRSALIELLNKPPSKDASVSAVCDLGGDATLSLVFEIDLFGEKKAVARKLRMPE